MYSDVYVTNHALTTLFTADEMAIIWAALKAYDVGPLEANPKLHAQLTKSLKELVEVFE